MSKNDANPNLARTGGMHDAVTAENARIAALRRARRAATTTAQTAGGPR